MKLPIYKKALEMSEEEVKKTLIPSKIKKAKKQAELELCKLDEQIAEAEDSINEQCMDEDVDFSEILDLQDDLGLLERKKAQYEKILADMFPDD